MLWIKNSLHMCRLLFCILITLQPLHRSAFHLSTPQQLFPSQRVLIKSLWVALWFDDISTDRPPPAGGRVMEVNKVWTFRVGLSWNLQKVHESLGGLTAWESLFLFTRRFDGSIYIFCNIMWLYVLLLYFLVLFCFSCLNLFSYSYITLPSFSCNYFTCCLLLF